jgi:hypothetical protein
VKRHLFIVLVVALYMAVPSIASDEEEKTETKATVEQKLIELELKILQMQRQHAEQMQELSEQIQALKQQLNQTEQPEPMTVQQPIPQDYGSGQRSLSNPENVFNPKISVISDMVGVYGKQGDNSLDNMAVREIEIGFSGHVDTWGRFDMTTTIHNEIDFDFGHGFEHLEDDHDHSEDEHAHGGGLEVEEAYFTFLTLPGGFQARVGKFRTSAGKTNEYHPHSLPWTEYPLAIRSYLGSEGLIGTGTSISWLLPTDLYTELTYEFYKANPHYGAAVAEEGVEDYSHLFNARSFFEISDNASVELGITSLLAPVDIGIEGDDTWLNSFDFTVKWMPFGDGTYRKLEWRTEVFGLRKTLLHHHEDDHADDHDHEHVDHDEDDHDHEDEMAEHEEELSRETMAGLYTSLAYRFNRWWEAGLRYDYVEGPYDLHQEEEEYGVFLTWWQSEYAFWRLNVIRNELTIDDVQADSLYKYYLQFNLSLGPHPAHKY